MIFPNEYCMPVLFVIRYSLFHSAGIFQIEGILLKEVMNGCQQLVLGGESGVWRAEILPELSQPI